MCASHGWSGRPKMAPLISKAAALPVSDGLLRMIFKNGRASP